MKNKVSNVLILLSKDIDEINFSYLSSGNEIIVVTTIESACFNVRHTLHIVNYLIITTTPWSSDYYFSHFRDEELRHKEVI